MAVGFLLQMLGFGFAIASVQGCGGNFTALTGIITSPNFPFNYSNELSCTYVIRAPDHYRITVNVTFFDVEKSEHCNDYLMVHDGDSQTAPIMLRLCPEEETLPVIRRSFENKMLIRFVSDAQGTAQGFLVTYTSANQGDSFFLIAASDSKSIIRMDTASATNYRIPMERRLYNPMAVTYDPLHSRVYWTEVSNALNAIRSAFLNGSDVRTLKTFGQESILEGLALDFHSRLLFYTDAGTQAIGMMSLSTLEHVIIVNSSLDQPRPIILDHRDGMMFWADVGGTARIEKAGYDGKDRRHIVNTRIAMVNGLAIDLENSRLYWADAITDDIEGSDLEGNNRFRVGGFTKSTSHVYGLVFFQGHLYMTNWGKMGPETNRSEIFRITVDNRNGSFIGSIAQRVNDIHAFHEFMPSYPNGCGLNNGGCQGFCIPLPRNSSKCMCAEDHSLALGDCISGVNTKVTRSSEETNPPKTQSSTSPSLDLPEDQSTKPLSESSIPIIAGVAGGLTVLVVIVIVVIVVVVKKKRSAKPTINSISLDATDLNGEHVYSHLTIRATRNRNCCFV